MAKLMPCTQTSDFAGDGQKTWAESGLQSEKFLGGGGEIVRLLPRLLIATLHVEMTGKQDGAYTQWTQLQRDYLRRVKISITHL